MDGLDQGRWALIFKVHHCLVDGVSGADLYRVIFDLTPEPAAQGARSPAVPAEPSGIALAVHAAADTLTLPARDVMALARALAAPRAAVRQARDTLQGTARLATALWPAPGSSLTGPIGRLAAVTKLMADLKASKEAAAGEAVVSLGRLTWFPLASLLVRVLSLSRSARSSRSPPTCLDRSFRSTRSAAGCRLLEMIPYVPIASRMRTGVSIFSYCGHVTFGITGDYDTTPDIEVLARGIETGVAELLAAARSRARDAS